MVLQTDNSAKPSKEKLNLYKNKSENFVFFVVLLQAFESNS